MMRWKRLRIFQHTHHLAHHNTMLRTSVSVVSPQPPRSGAKWPHCALHRRTDPAVPADRAPCRPCTTCHCIRLQGLFLSYNSDNYQNVPRRSFIKTRFSEDRPSSPSQPDVILVRPKSLPRTILSIDGGGMRGVVPARVLKELEDIIQEVIRENWTVLKARGAMRGEAQTMSEPPPKFDIDICDYFDVLAGTSIGAVLATYLATKGEYLSEEMLSGNERKGSIDAALSILKRYGPVIFKRPQSEKELQDTLTAYIDQIHGDIPIVSKLLGFLPAFMRKAAISWMLGLLDKRDPAVPWVLDDDLRWKALGAIRVLYPKDGVEETLKGMFGDSKLSNGLKTSLLVPTYDLETSGPLLFSYIHDNDEAKRLYGYIDMAERFDLPQEAIKTLKGKGLFRYNISCLEIGKPTASAIARFSDHVGMSAAQQATDFHLWQVTRASSAAPTYFPPARVTNTNGTPQPFSLVDGGVVCNNPEMAALSFAMRVGSVKSAEPLRLKDVAVLSVGCGTADRSRVIPDEAGQLTWVGPGSLVGMFMQASNDLTTGMLTMLQQDKVAQGLEIGHEQLLRVQATRFNGAKDDDIAEILTRMDNPGDYDRLLEIGADLAKTRRADMKTFVERYIFTL